MTQLCDKINYVINWSFLGNDNTVIVASIRLLSYYMLHQCILYITADVEFYIPFPWQDKL